MGTPANFKKHLLIPAIMGAALTYGALSLIDDDSLQREQITSLENRILDLELSLAQKEEELADARFFSAGAFGLASTSEPAPNLATNQQAAVAAPNTQSEHSANEQGSNVAVDSQQLLKDLVTLSDRDPRSFSEKANDLLARNASKENIAVVSKSVFDLAENPDVLPDYELQSLYQNQSNPDLQRVIAQVMSTRGDNGLLEKQIAKTQTSLSSENPAIRQQALVELGKTRYASAANAIVPLLQDSDTNVKLDALLALRATGNQSHVRLVETLVSHPDPAVSWLAKDVVNSLQNLSERARTQLASTDIVAELPVIAAP
ncbi:HEAT repeat domain-containing protein [Cellvibrio sp.]